MTPPPVPKTGCPNQQAQCNLQCKYNHFEAGELEIHAWELKCLDCGFRQTIGFRSDETEPEVWQSGQPKICPFCEKTGLQPGKNPCQAIEPPTT